MSYKNVSDKTPVGVIGSGSFGTAIANLVAENRPVLLYSRRPEKVKEINDTKMCAGQSMHNRIIATNDMERVCSESYLLFPSVPSSNFRSMLQDFSPYLRPDHILVHTTKGLDVIEEATNTEEGQRVFNPANILTMSKVILEETNVKRIGCLSGPNLSRELALNQPAATVIASRFDEVIREASAVIKGPRFQVYSSHDIVGVELAGILKNTLAIAAGALSGMGYGQNTLSFLLSRGIREIIKIGTALGANKAAFLGLAGIGDIIATCTSPLSRNFTVGYRIAQGESLDYIISTSSEVAEGLKTVNICYMLGQELNINLPIIHVTYRVLFEDWHLAEAITFLMNTTESQDVDYI